MSTNDAFPKYHSCFRNMGWNCPLNTVEKNLLMLKFTQFKYRPLLEGEVLCIELTRLLEFAY